uniref:ATPase inhibitor, mitochondrial n=1 Tax=Heterocephalus glaber TaxID=10181 RepID=A0A0P6J910_HETGA
MAGTALASRARLGVWGVRAMQTRGFSSDKVRHGTNCCPTPECESHLFLWAFTNARVSALSQDHESSSGSIRDAGGAFGKREQAEEERFFRQKTKEQLEALKKHHEDEIYHHKKAIEHMEKEIERHKQKIKQLKHDD